jgi:hypothetical protein
MSPPILMDTGPLVALSELHQGSIVFTVDSHFRIYRRHGRQVIQTLIPPSP